MYWYQWTVFFVLFIYLFFLFHRRLLSSSYRHGFLYLVSFPSKEKLGSEQISILYSPFLISICSSNSKTTELCMCVAILFLYCSLDPVELDGGIPWGAPRLTWSLWPRAHCRAGAAFDLFVLCHPSECSWGSGLADCWFWAGGEWAQVHGIER